VTQARELPKPTLQAFEVLLCIRHPSIDPAEISRELGVAADHSFKAGQPRQSHTGPSAAARHTESYWLAALNPGSWSLDISFPGSALSIRANQNLRAMAKAVLGRALSLCTTRFLRPHGPFLHRLQAEGGQVRLLVEINPGILDGFTLTPDVARELSELGIAVDFEFAAS
jgi:hypothetical protein